MQGYNPTNQQPIQSTHQDMRSQSDTAYQEPAVSQTPQTQPTNMLDSLKYIPKFTLFWKAAVVVLILLFAISYVPRWIFKPSTLTVIGEGKLEFEAEKVTMIVTRSDIGTDSVNTINEGEINTNLLIDSAKAVAGPEAVITKAFYQVQPIVAASGIQYQAVNAFSIETSSVENTNEIIKTLYRDGATTVGNVSFGSNNKEAVAQEARKLAVKDAKNEAKDIAKAAGKRVGRLVSIVDDNQTAQSALSNVNTENQNFNNVSITKRVSVIYEIW